MQIYTGCMFKITVCCLKWGSKTTSLSCLSYCVCIEGCNGCDEQWKVYYGTSIRCYHQNTSGFVVFVLIYWLKTRGTIWIILLLLTARSTTTIIIVSSSGFILVSNFCRARCSLFVLKVPLNSNQPSVIRPILFSCFQCSYRLHLHYHYHCQ